MQPKGIKRGKFYAALILFSSPLLLLAVFFGIDGVSSADRFDAPLPAVNISARQHNEPTIIKGDIERLSIPSLGIDLAVLPGYYDEASKTWTLDKQNLFRDPWTENGSFSTDIDDKPLLIYGHNFNSVLGKTKNIQPGSQMSVVLSDGTRVDLTYAYSNDLAPEDTSILDHQGPERIMLMTCSGLWDEKRRVMFFDLTETDKQATT